MEETREVEFSDGSSATVLRDSEGVTVIDSNLPPTSPTEYVSKVIREHNLPTNTLWVLSNRIAFNVRIVQENTDGSGKLVALIRNDSNLTLKYVTPIKTASGVGNEERFSHIPPEAPTFCVNVDSDAYEGL